MKKEGKLQEEEAKDEEEEKLGDQPENEADENPEPTKEDCYEYSLAGVTIHSGSANSGHYWAYACGERDGLRKYNGESVNHGEAKWYEYNDSRVSDWDINKIKSEAFGGDKNSGGYGSVGVSSLDGWGGGSSFGGGGSSYGQSGYLLIYERKVKKPIQMTRWVPDDSEPVVEGEEPKMKEETYDVDYHQCVESHDKPNKIFHQVLD
jgi:hypothetical protein